MQGQVTIDDYRELAWHKGLTWMGDDAWLDPNIKTKWKCMACPLTFTASYNAVAAMECHVSDEIRRKHSPFGVSPKGKKLLPKKKAQNVTK